VPGLIDIDPIPDETRLLGVASRQVHVLDPTSLATLATASQAASWWKTTEVDSTAWPRHKTVVHHQDGEAIAVTRDRSLTGVRALFFDALRPAPEFDWQFGTAPMGSLLEGGAERPYALLTSPSRDWLLAQRPSSTEPLGGYGFSHRGFHVAPVLVGLDAKVPTLSASDDGRGVLLADGLFRDQFSGHNMMAMVPADRVADGFSLSGDGRYGLVYSYRLAGTAPAETASDPELMVIDASNPTNMTVVARLPMVRAVGCGMPRALGEGGCRHQAAVGVDAAGRMAAVLGPRGIEVVPLPAVLQTAASVRSRPLQRRETVLPVRAPATGSP
jgi:hypothetical protein